MRWLAFVPLAATILSCSALADELSDSTLAHFAAGEFSLEHSIQFPKVEGDIDQTLFCIARIERNGAISRNDCLISDYGKRPFFHAITLATVSTQAIPAKVNGLEYEADLYYRAVFVRRDGNETIRVLPNWGFDSDKYGPEYQAPQRYVSHNYPIACYREHQYAVLTATTIDSNGKIDGDVSFTFPNNLRISQRCIAAIREKMKSGKYIPGRKDGKPIVATFAEVWGDYARFATD